MSSSRLVFAALVVTGMLLVAPVLAVIQISGEVTSDTTWTNADTIHIVATVTVTPTAHLTVEAGTIIMTNPSTGLYIDGQITAGGTGSNPVVFTSRSDTLGGNPGAGDWVGVNLRSNSNGQFTSCHFRYATNAIWVSYSTAAFLGCQIEEFSARGIWAEAATTPTLYSLSVDRCVIRQTKAGLIGTGIYAYRAIDLRLSRSRITGCQYGVDLYGSTTYTPHFKIDSCDISYNANYNIYLRTSTG